VSVAAFQQQQQSPPNILRRQTYGVDKTHEVALSLLLTRCGHCKKMAPDWEKLSSEWEGDKIGLIAEVDCTTEGKPLCDANGIKGFPTLKHGDPAALDDYSGGRSYADLAKFAKENLKPVCSPGNLDLCEADKKKQIEDFMAKSDAELLAAVAEEEKKIADADANFKSEVEKLQATYQKLSADKDAAIEAVKASGLGLMKSVMSFKSKSADKKDEL
jgi:thiol-disulfide isomerase/thioredoxin